MTFPVPVKLHDLFSKLEPKISTSFTVSESKYCYVYQIILEFAETLMRLKQQ